MGGVWFAVIQRMDDTVKLMAEGVAFMCAGVKVAVDNAAFKFDRLYTYSVPPDLEQYAKVGARVLVPFGNGAPRMGIVLELCEAVPDDKLKSVTDIERTEPLIDKELVRLILLLHETAFCTYYDAVKAVLPKNSRLVPDSERASLEKQSAGHIETVYSYTEKSVPERLSEKQRSVCDLIKNNPLTAVQISERTGCTRGVVERLAEKGIVDKTDQTKEDETYRLFLGEKKEIPDLTTAQTTALNDIEKNFSDPTKPDVTLLYGVTSSGKTHIYIKLIETAVGKGRGALVLVPEIALATQMIYRLKELFGTRVGIIHSSLSDSERQIQWENIKSGRYDVIVGTRSAVFAPIRRLGIIIIDEEQEQTFVSEQNPRFDACAVARFRAKENSAKLLLSSATPSVESYYYAKTGVYNLVSLSERFGNMPLPKVRVVDMREELLAGNSHHISQYLKDEIDERIKRREQCILLLNRRGYRTISMCCKCKKIIKCESCDTPLVIHKNRGCYVCHYCRKTYPIAEECGECGGKIKHAGIGTQKIEEELESLFPDARILRLDFDAVQKKNSLEKHLSEFQNGEYDIIIGTQMIAKGLDFKNVTLVGVLSIDQLMLMPSFKANERTFSMLTQVVGRSGRGDKVGEAIIQTVDPENSIIKLAAKQDYESFYTNEIVSRKLHLYPPFCTLCSIGVISSNDGDAGEAALEFAKIVERVQAERYSTIPIRVLGPSPMRVAYVNDIFRYRIVLKCRGDRQFRDFLRECIVIWNRSAYNNKAKIFVDFNNELDG
ncbi:MAG: primosomal protein N' [Oscillospiraceae bacterium]